MRAQLSLELLIYAALAGLSLLVALAAAGRIMQAYHVGSLLHFSCIAALRNASVLCT